MAPTNPRPPLPPIATALYLTFLKLFKAASCEGNWVQRTLLFLLGYNCKVKSLYNGVKIFTTLICACNFSNCFFILNFIVPGIHAGMLQSLKI